MTSLLRQSPLHDALEHLNPHWSPVRGMPAAIHFGDPQAEATKARTLGLCDLSPLPRIGVKGAGAEAWLQGLGLALPSKIYEHLPINNDGLIIRTGISEFFIEEGIHGDSPLQSDRLPPSVYRFNREDAAMALGGDKLFEVMEQTCGYNFRAAQADFVMTRVAGVSCSVLIRSVQPTPLLRIWCDPSYGLYLWEALLQIVKECGGGAVGMGWLIPDLLK